MNTISTLILLMLILPLLACSDAREQEADPLRSFAKSFRQDYPFSQAQDLYKSLYQDAFGPGHIITNWDFARNRLESEIAHLPEFEETRLTEPCGPSGNMLRLNLRPAVRMGITTETIIGLMQRTMERLRPDTVAFLAQWDRARALASQGQFPWTSTEMENFDETLSPSGLDVIHHSREYAANYHPAYRVILAEVFREWESRNTRSTR
ncbi:MAG: hypothetical protein M5R41_16270 [Bacteroidia bacterium]|nr:hypothetical protein [Bacteroidia bacterium]